MRERFHAVTAKGTPRFAMFYKRSRPQRKLLAQCGACTAIVEGEATRTCVFPLSVFARRIANA